MDTERDVSIGGWMFSNILDALQDGFISLFNGLADNFGGLALIITTLYVVLIGFSAVQGKFGEASKSMMFTVFLVPICYGLAFDIDMFFSFIYNPIVDTMFSMMQLFFTSISPSDVAGNGSITSIYVPVEDAFGRLFTTIDTLTTENTGWGFGDIKISIAAVLLTLVYGGLYVLFSVLLIMAIFSLHIMIVIAPITVFFAAFKPTRGIFTAWLKAVLTYALVPIFTVIVMAYTLQFLNLAIQDLAAMDVDNDGVFNGAMASALFIGILSFSLHWKAPEFASAITGAQVSGVGAFFGAAAAVGAAGIGASKAISSSSGGQKLSEGIRGAGSNILQNGLVGSAQNAYSKMRGFT